MRHATTTFGIGVLLTALPLLALPSSWKNAVMILLGMWLIALAFSGLLRRGGAYPPDGMQSKVSGNSFVENAHHAEVGGVRGEQQNHDQSPQV